MKTIFLWVALCAALTSCQTDTATTAVPTDFKNGTRLVGRTLSFPGTEPLLIGVHDTRAGKDCVFVPEPNDPDEFRCKTSDSSTDDVRGKLVVDPSDQPLSTRWIQSEDGSRFPPAGKGGAQIVDTRWNVPCFVQSSHERVEVECAPEAASGGFFFADAMCTTPLAYASRDKRIAMLEGKLFAVGPRWQGPTFSGTREGCTPNPAEFGSALQFFPIAGVLPDKIAKVQVVDQGSGRLLRRKVFDESRQLALHPYEAFFDTTAQTVCSPMRTGEGTVRCVFGMLTVNHRADPMFADVNCTKPAVIGYGGSQAGDLIALLSDEAEIPTASSLHAVETVLGHKMFKKATGRCVESLSRQTVVELGPAKSWDQFASLQESTQAVER